MNRREFVIASCLVALILLLINIWAWIDFQKAKGAALDAIHETEVCRQLANHIIALRVVPTMSGNSKQVMEELTARIQASAQSSGIVSEDIASIAPDAPNRIQDSAYLEQSTTIELRQVTFVQLVDLLYKLSDNRMGLCVKSVHLISPPGRSDGNLWNAEMSVSSLIYAPAPRRRTS